MSLSNIILNIILLYKIVYTMKPYLEWIKPIKRKYPYNDQPLPIDFFRKRLKLGKPLNIFNDNKSLILQQKKNNNRELACDSYSEDNSYYSSLEELQDSNSFSNEEETHYIIEDYINHVSQKKNNRENININVNDNNKKIEKNSIKIKSYNIKDNENDNNNHDNNINENSKRHSIRKYINEELYPLVNQRLNLNPINLNIIDVEGDGNCLYRCLARFIYGTEDLNLRVRDEIYQEALNRINNYPDITIETEIGPMLLYDYIHHIDTPGFYGGELEITIAIDIYNINISTYNDNENRRFSFIRYYNNNKDENLHLLILSNADNVHFQLAYYKKNSKIDFKYKIPQTIIEQNFENKVKNDDQDNDSIINSIQIKEPEIYSILKKFENKTLNEKLLFYNNKINSVDLYDIYYYVYYLKLNQYKEGKYSEKFKNLFKGKDYKSKK